MFNSLKSLGFFASFVFFWALTSATAPEALFKAKGDNVVLDPHHLASSVTSLEWKHGSNIAAEWLGGDPECFLQFKGRCTLDKSTGALTITELDGSENGIFSVTINNKQIDTQISLSVIAMVPKPTILPQCDTDTTFCNLTCDGNTTDAEPVSYTWFAGGVKRGSDKELKITKETEEESFTCMLHNPVSNHSSDSFSNPIVKDKRNRMISIIISSIIIITALILACGIASFINKKRKSRSHDFTGASGRAEQGTKEEMKELIVVNGEAVQPNVAHIVPEVHNETNQGSAYAVTQNGVGGSDAQRVSVQVLAPAEPQNDGNSSEVMAETSKQDPESDESPGTSKETENTLGTGETPNQDLTVHEPLNTSKESENSAVTSNNHESTNHKPALVEGEADDGGNGD